MPRFCPECGNQNTEKAKFCISCGEKIPAVSTSDLLDNRYEIITSIKSGEIGFVYKGRDIRLDNFVVIKEIISTFTTEEEELYAQQRFWEEARLLTQLQHKGLPKIINFFTGIDRASGRNASYLVMTYVEGKNLEGLITERGKGIFPLDEVLDYFRQILAILHYLHSRTPPFIFREIKPSHIMIFKNNVYLVDFGIARIFAPRKGRAAKEFNGFTAPEQSLDFAEPRSDLYSLGAVIYYLLTGKHPEKSLKSPSDFQHLKKINPGVPNYLDEIIMSMIEDVCEKRPLSAEAILKKLDESCSQKVSSTRTVHLNQTSPQIAPQSENASFPTEEMEMSRQTPPSPHVLFNAIKCNSVSGVQKYIAGGGNIKIVSQNGVTPLHDAAEKGYTEIVELLIKSGAEVNAVAKQGWTPLHSAAVTGDVNVAKLLLTYGADVNAKNIEGKTPLHRAIHWKHAEMIKFLVEKGADINSADNEGVTPLLAAIAIGGEGLIKFLISKGADINYRDKNGSTPLHHSASCDNIGSLKLLLLSGADINVQNKDGITPLHLVAQKKYGFVVDLLVDLGANINVRDKEGRTPLHYAAQGDFSMVAFLASRGAEINARDNRGSTPLRLAERAGLLENSSILRKFGAS